MTTTSTALEEAGISTETAAASIARVFGLLTNTEDPGDPVGWEDCIKAAEGSIGGDDGNDFALSVTKFAEYLRSVYGFALDPDYQPTATEGLPPLMKQGWEGVARHTLNVFALDPQEARKLDQHEARMAQFVRERASAPPK